VTEVPDGRVPDPIECSQTRPTPPRPTGSSSPAVASKVTIPEREDQKAGRARRGSAGGRPRSFDAEAYKGRNVVERCFNKLKQWRGIATRFDKTAQSYLAGLTLAATLVWTR